MKAFLDKFFHSWVYLALIGSATFYVWTMGLWDIGIPVILGLMFLLMICFKDTTATLPLFFNALFMFGQVVMTFDEVPFFLYLIPVEILLGMVLHAIIYKQRFFQGMMLPGILVMLVALALSTINAINIDLNYAFYALIAMLYAFVYFSYTGSVGKNRETFLLKIFFEVGLVICAEILIFYLRQEDLQLAIANKTLTLGWGVSNYVATYLILFIPSSLYFAKTIKNGFPFLIIFGLECLAVFFTMSRAGILAFLAILPLLLFFYAFHAGQWWKTLLNLLLVIGILSFFVWWQYDVFVTMFARFFDRGLDDTGRIAIWIEALAMFWRYPLFGGGIFAKLDAQGIYRMYHNTFLHVMATMGLVGLVGLCMQLFVQFKVLLKKMTMESAILAIGVLGAQIHGMVDNIYLMPQFMVILVVIVAIMENRTPILKIA